MAILHSHKVGLWKSCSSDCSKVKIIKKKLVIFYLFANLLNFDVFLIVLFYLFFLLVFTNLIFVLSLSYSRFCPLLFVSKLNSVDFAFYLFITYNTNFPALHSCLYLRPSLFSLYSPPAITSRLRLPSPSFPSPLPSPETHFFPFLFLHFLLHILSILPDQMTCNLSFDSSSHEENSQYFHQ